MLSKRLLWDACLLFWIQFYEDLVFIDQQVYFKYHSVVWRTHVYETPGFALVTWSFPVFYGSLLRDLTVPATMNVLVHEKDEKIYQLIEKEISLSLIVKEWMNKTELMHIHM